MNAVLRTAAFLAAAAAAPAWSDVVRVDAGRVVGEVIDAERADSKDITIALPHGRVVLPQRRVTRVERQSPAAVEHRRRAPTVSDTAEAQFAFGLWCRANGLARESRACFRRVIELDPDHAEARRMLGYERVGGVWMTQEDKLVARGLVRWEGDYITPQEVELLRRQEAAKRSALDWRRRVESVRQRLRSPDPDVARAADEELASLNDAAAAPAILNWLDNEPSPGARRRLVRTLGQIATPVALDRLLAAALTDADPDLRAEARVAIASLRPPGMLDPFVAALGANDNAIVNNAAIALAEYEATSLVGPLIDALVTTHRRVLSPGSDGQRYDINTASGQFNFGGGGPRIATGELRNPDVLSALVALTGQNYLYDKAAWRSWLAQQQVDGAVDLRRDH